MAITAESGPHILGFQSAPISGMPANLNPDIGPNLANVGIALLDPRGPYTFIPGGASGKKVYGHLMPFVSAIDQVPITRFANNIATAQTATANTALTLVSSNTTGVTTGVSITRADTGATVTGLLALDSAQTSVSFGNSGTIQLWDPTTALARNVIIASNGADQTGTFTISGFDVYGFPMTETLSGTNATTSVGAKAFKYIRTITPAGTVNSTGIMVGTGDVFGLPLRVDRMANAMVYWGTPPAMVDASTTASSQTVTLPITLAQITSTAVFDVAVPFNGRVTSVLFRDFQAAVTTGSASLLLRVNGTTGGVTGGAVVLTATNTSASGATVAGSAITAGNTFTAGQTIGMAGSSITATFATGSGQVEFTVVNNDVGGATFTAAVTTAATATSGDVRGTIAVPTASDGTRRLVAFVAVPPAAIGTATSIYGPTQA